MKRKRNDSTNKSSENKRRRTMAKSSLEQQPSDIVLLTDSNGRTIKVKKSLLMDSSEYFAELLSRSDNPDKLHINENYLIEMMEYLYNNESMLDDQSNLEQAASDEPNDDTPLSTHIQMHQRRLRSRRRRRRTWARVAQSGRTRSRSRSSSEDRDFQEEIDRLFQSILNIDLEPVARVEQDDTEVRMRNERNEQKQAEYTEIADNLIHSDLEILLHLLRFSEQYKFKSLGSRLASEVDMILKPSTVIPIFKLAKQLNLKDIESKTKLLILSWLPFVQKTKAFLTIPAQYIYEIFESENVDIDSECKLNALSAWWTHNKEKDMTNLWIKLIGGPSIQQQVTTMSTKSHLNTN